MTLIIGGAALQADTPDGPLELTPRKEKYQKTFTGSNGYAEALLSLEKAEKLSRKKRKIRGVKVILSRTSGKDGFIFILHPETMTVYFR